MSGRLPEQSLKALYCYERIRVCHLSVQCIITNPLDTCLSGERQNICDVVSVKLYAPVSITLWSF